MYPELKAKRRLPRKSSCVSKNCIVCNKQFFAHRKNQIYCSEHCKRKSELLTRKGESRNRYCKDCGRRIWSKPHDSIYCSACDYKHGDIYVLVNGKWILEKRP